VEKIKITQICVCFLLVATLALGPVVNFGAAQAQAQGQQASILVDLTHAERVSVGGEYSKVNIAGNPTIVDLEHWTSFLREKGYSVASLTDPPITSEKLKGWDILIIAQPDINEEGEPAYFSPGETLAIKEFVHEGGGLLLIGDAMLGVEGEPMWNIGATVGAIAEALEYLLFRRPIAGGIGQCLTECSYEYRYPEILNDLLASLDAGIRFNWDMICYSGPIPMAIGKGPMFMTGPRTNVWITSGDKGHPLWQDVEGILHGMGCSLDITGDAKAIATGDETMFAAERPLGGVDAFMGVMLNPTPVEPAGGNPVVIAEVKYGKGKILAWGDLTAWISCHAQMTPVFDWPMWGIQQLTLNMMSYLSTP
jgi:hypothetical protein